MAILIFGSAYWKAHSALLDSDFLFPVERPAVLNTEAGGAHFSDGTVETHTDEQAYFALDFDNGSSRSVQIIAAKAGKVTHVGSLPFENNERGVYWVPNVVISHGNGIFTQYLEFVTASSPEEAISQIRVQEGNTVQPGQVIGLMKQEKTTHLHFQVKYDPNPNSTGEGKNLSKETAPLGHITVGGRAIEAFDLTTPVGEPTPVDIGIKTTGSTNTPLNHINSAKVLGSFTLGITRDGEMTVRNGANISSDGAQIGDFRKRGRGEVTLTDGSAWTNDGAITIGDGEIVITKGAKVTTDLLGIGASIAGDKSNALVEVSGDQSRLEINSNTGVSIGLHSRGRLEIKNGGVVEGAGAAVGGVAGGAPNEFADGDGRVTVTGADSEWLNSGPVVIGYRGGKGKVIITKGAKATSSFFQIGPDGYMRVDGRSSAIHLDGGEFHPGSSPGTAIIDGDFIFSRGRIELETENGIADRIIVSGLVKIGSVALFDLFFDVLPETIGISEFFGGSELVFDPAFHYSNISVFTSNQADVGTLVEVLFGDQQAHISSRYGIPSAVPIPAALPLFTCALLVLISFRWLRKRPTHALFG